jgi:hypothetical protein
MEHVPNGPRLKAVILAELFRLLRAKTSVSSAEGRAPGSVLPSRCRNGSSFAGTFRKAAQFRNSSGAARAAKRARFAQGSFSQIGLSCQQGTANADVASGYVTAGVGMHMRSGPSPPS